MNPIDVVDVIGCTTERRRQTREVLEGCRKGLNEIDSLKLSRSSRCGDHGSKRLQQRPRSKAWDVREADLKAVMMEKRRMVQIWRLQWRRGDDEWGRRRLLAKRAANKRTTRATREREKSISRDKEKERDREREMEQMGFGIEREREQETKGRPYLGRPHFIYIYIITIL